MNESIIYYIVFSLYDYVLLFKLETSSPLLNLFKVTHIYYKINFRYRGLPRALRHMVAGCLFWFNEFVNIYIFGEL